MLLVAIASGVALHRHGDDHPPAGLTVVWEGSEGHPSCRYDATTRTVAAKLTIDGEAPRRRQVTVTVTAYADENTSIPVGTASSSVYVEGSVHTAIQRDHPRREGTPHRHRR